VGLICFKLLSFMTTPRPSPILTILAFAAVYIIWGSTYLGIRLAIETLPPFLMAGTRFSLAGAILLSWSIVKGERVPRSRTQWGRAFIVGALLLLCGNGGVTWAEKFIATGLAALLVATEPLWVVMLVWFLSRRRPNSKVLLGVIIGLAGVALLVSDRLGQGHVPSFLEFMGASAVLVAGFAWASGSVYSSRRPIQASTSMAAGMQMLAGGSLLFLLGMATGDFKHLNLSTASWTSIAAFFYLLVCGSLIGFTAYSWLLNNVTPSSAATYGYVNPVVAVFLGWLIASEPITLRMLSAAAVIITSVILITTFGRDHTPTSAALHDSDCPTPPCA
jgi:drug/metabolite transporter (DMT)-like permease